MSNGTIIELKRIEALLMAESEQRTTVNPDLPLVLTAGQLARLLGVHINTVRNWSDRGVLPVYRIGPRRDRRFRRDEISTILESSRDGHNQGNA